MFGSQSDSFDWDSVLDSYGVTEYVQTASETLNNSQQQPDSLHASSSDGTHLVIDEKPNEGVDAIHDYHQPLVDDGNLVTEWQQRTQLLLNELFNIKREIKLMASNWEKNAADLSHHIQLARLMYDLSIQSYRNYYPAGNNNVEMVSPPKADSLLADVSLDTAGCEEAVASAKLRAAAAPTLAPVQVPGRIDLLMSAAATAEVARTPIKALHGARMGGIGMAAAAARPAPIGAPDVHRSSQAAAAAAASTQIAAIAATAAASCSRPTRVVSQLTTQQK